MGSVGHENRRFYSQFPDLFGQQSIFGVVGGSVDDIGINSTYLRKLTSKVAVARLNIGCDQHLAPHFPEGFQKEIPQANAIICLGDVNDYRRCASAHCYPGLSGSCLTLEGIVEASSKHIFLVPGNQETGGRG